MPSRVPRLDWQVGKVLLGGLSAVLLMLAGCGESPPPVEEPVEQVEAPPEPEPEPEPEPPPPKPIELSAVGPITLEPGGTATVDLKIQRNDNQGSIQVQFGPVPDGIHVAPAGTGGPPGGASDAAADNAAAPAHVSDEYVSGEYVSDEYASARPAPAEPAKSEEPKEPEPVPEPKPGTARAFSIPEGQSEAKVQVAAEEGLGEEDLAATIDVTVKVGEQEAKQSLALSVPKLSLPSFLPAEQVILQPGASRSIELAVDRREFEGPLELSVQNVPEKVTAEVQNIEAGQTDTKLDVTVAAGAPDAVHKLRVAARLYGRTVDVEVPVKVEGRPFHVAAFRVVNLKPGETQEVKVPVERSSYQGPLQVKTDALPPGITIKGTQVAADQKEATLEVAAAEDADERVHSASLVSTGGHLTSTEPIVIRISRGDETYLPPGVTANPEVAPLLRRGSIGGRLTSESKQALLEFYGGTPESEAAVMRGLKWLAAHQQKEEEQEGSWSMKGYDEEEFEKEVYDNAAAGTAFGVLPFLGAGVTHRGAPEDPPELAGYQEPVLKGLVYLTRNQVESDKNNDGHLGGNMYAHALGTIALCEAYGLSGDDRLKIYAQKAIKYLINAQHDTGGGWRYSSGQSGDMSVTGWVFLAIRSAQLAGLMIDESPLLRAERFVDSCAAGPEDARNSQYSYTPEQTAKLTLTAAGLLTRQYLGWRKEHPHLVAGCEHLMQHLPPESADKLGQIYYYYYATQVLHHMEGSNFDLWNHRVREHLIRTQVTQGENAGSWNPQGVDWGARGGRMYATAMALMTLQVYYRHLPMYRPVRRTVRDES